MTPRVNFRGNERNLGMSGNFNALARRREVSIWSRSGTTIGCCPNLSRDWSG